MPRRRRWTPVKGTGTRVCDAGRARCCSPRARPAAAACCGPRRAPRRGPALGRGPVREVLVLRLDRIGDVLMSLPALADLRARLPRGPHPAGRRALERGDRAARARGRGARLERALGRAGRSEGARDAARALRARRARCARPRLDLALDLQGDVRAAWLMAPHGRARARRLREHRRRAGCSPTWCRSTRPSPGSSRTAARSRRRRGGRDRARAPRRARSPRPIASVARAILRRGRASTGSGRWSASTPAAGAPSSSGRLGRWREVARAPAARSSGPTVAAHRHRRRPRRWPRRSRGACAGRSVDLTGRLVRARDAGRDRRPRPVPLPRHRAHAHGGCAVGTPSVSVFGPSDPRALLLGRDGRAGHAPRGGAPRPVVRALQPHPPAARTSAVAPTARSACASSPSTRSTPRPRAPARRRLPPPRGGRGMKTLGPRGRRRRAAARARRRSWPGTRAAERAAARRGRPAHRGRGPGPRAAGRRGRGRHARGRRSGAAGPCSTAAASAISTRWKGVSLWWFAELYLHHSTEAPRYVRVIETVHRLLDAEAPDEVEAARPARGRGAARRAHLHRARRALPWPRRGRAASRSAGSRPSVGAAAGTRSRPGPPRPRPRWPGAAARAAAGRARRALPLPRRLLAGARRATRASAARVRALLRPADPGRWREHGALRALRGGGRAAGGVPPARAAASGSRTGCACTRDGEAPTSTSTATTARRVLREVRRGHARSPARVWRALRREPGRARGLLPSRRRASPTSAEADLAATLLLQLPWAIRSYEEMAAVLAAVRPAVVCLYAESSGWGRAALAACRAAGVPTVAVQHGIVYPKYYSYRARPRRGRLPAARPHRGLRRGGAAAPRRAGPLPAARPWWSPAARKFDELLRAARATWDRGGAARAAWACADGRAAGGRGQPLPRHPRHPPVHRQRVPGAGARRGGAAGRARLVKPHPAEAAERLRRACCGSAERARRASCSAGRRPAASCCTPPTRW